MDNIFICPNAFIIAIITIIIASWFVFPALTKNFKANLGFNMDPPDDGSLMRLHLSKMRAADVISATVGDEDEDE